MPISIISISLVNGKFNTSTSNSEFIQNIKMTKIIIKPKTFKDLYNQIFSDSKLEKNQIIIGLLHDDQKIEIIDENYEDNKDKISFYFGCMSKNDAIIEEETLNKIKSINVPFDQDLVDHQSKEIEKLTTKISSEIGQAQNNLFNSFIDEFDESLNKSLNESLNNIVLKVSTKNIQKVKDLRKSVNLFSNKLFQRANSCIYLSKQNSKEIKEVKKLLKQKTQKFDEEKVFEFCDNSLSIEETVSNPKFEVKNIKIKNNSKSKDYQSNALVWIKETKSNEDLNFNQEEIKNEFAFIKDQCYPKEKEIDDLTLKLYIREPKEQEYKIYLSIKDTETKKIISKSPLEITVKMKPNPWNLNDIWKNLKQLEFFEILDKNDEIIKKIQSENGNLSKVKEWVEQEIENKKQSKIKELLVKYKEDFKSTTVAEDESKQKDIMLKNKFNEQEIKNWINENQKKNPMIDEKAEEIFVKLNEEFQVEDFLKKEEVIAKIKELNYNYEQAFAWVEDQI